MSSLSVVAEPPPPADGSSDEPSPDPCFGCAEIFSAFAGLLAFCPVCCRWVLDESRSEQPSSVPAPPLVVSHLVLKDELIRVS